MSVEVNVCTATPLNATTNRYVIVCGIEKNQWYSKGNILYIYSRCIFYQTIQLYLVPKCIYSVNWNNKGYY